MGSRYMISYRNFGDEHWTGEYQSMYFIPALIAFIKYRIKYEHVNLVWRAP